MEYLDSRIIDPRIKVIIPKEDRVLYYGDLNEAQRNIVDAYYHNGKRENKVKLLASLIRSFRKDGKNNIEVQLLKESFKIKD